MEIITADQYRGMLEKKQKTVTGSKYNNTIVKVHTKLFGEVSFDSKAEYSRYQFHESMVAQGHYTLDRQVSYDINVNNTHICKYIADFVLTYPDGIIVVEDVKGVKTDVYRIKKMLMKACHGIEIKEIMTGKAKRQEKRDDSKKKKQVFIKQENRKRVTEKPSDPFSVIKVLKDKTL